MVLVAHTPQLGGVERAGAGVAGLSERLGVGVWVFFGVSGYLIAGPFLRALISGASPPSVRRYALRRSARILPAYWIVFAVVLVFASRHTAVSWWQVPVHALLLHGLVPGQLQTLFFVAWTLGFEAIFYMLVPLGAALVRRAVRGAPIPADRLALAIALLWIVAVVETLVLALAFPLHGFAPLPGAVQILGLAGGLANFCPGMLVFVAETVPAGEGPAWIRVYRSLVSRPLLTLPVAVLLFALATQLPTLTSHVAFVLSYPLCGIASGLVLGTALHASRLSRTVRLLAPIGLISYGVYLWHWAVLQVILNQHGILFAGSGVRHVLQNLFVLLALTLPFAALSWIAVERPLIRRTAGWDRGATEAVPSAAVPVAATTL